MNFLRKFFFISNSYHYLLLATTLFLLSTVSSTAQSNPANGPKRVRHQINLGPVLSFYKNHELHTANTKAKPGFNVSYKMDIFLKKRTSFLVGLEYMAQGLTFNGYYKAPGSTYIFDKTYPYTHEIRYNELQLPLCFKFAFNKEKDNNYTPYFAGGVDFRYIFSSYTVITNDSTNATPYDGKTDITFETFVFGKNVNTNIKALFGVQRNFRKKEKVIYFELTYRYGISKIHYEGKDESNNLNIKDASLGITFGLRL